MCPEWCELLVLHCERACAEAKVSALRDLLEDVKSARGLFAAAADGEGGGGGGRADARLIAEADKDIVSHNTVSLNLCGLHLC